MSKGYWVARVDVTDPEKYKTYITANAVAFAKYGARFLVRSGAFEVVEGTARSRNVLIEFASYQMALDCWNSPEYQAARECRVGAATADVIVIEGYEGAQPG
ncbi:hypothetical protein CHU94_07740 [Rhodoferax sp. TH121]|uniref:DUF1330 domain-containing protein n=1 Tax=Rhodoferax sp. TH121 TaxID=2022803 RepID=UPI000B96DD6F|nr:DUF1330 domain-containing protein [Rhodoferax sp. TH121]OYQ41000.1 hypothetical protein CHU94_07740 [Rhodoferax sp. TH121]